MRECKICGGTIRWTDIDGWVHVPLGSDHFGVPVSEDSDDDRSRHALETLGYIKVILDDVRDLKRNPIIAVGDIERLIHKRDPVDPRTSGRER